RHGFWEKLFLLCELTMPSLAALVVMYAAVALADGLFLLKAPAQASAFWSPILFGCLGLMTTALALYAMVPFLRLRLPWRFGLSILSFPVYLLWKFRVI